MLDTPNTPLSPAVTALLDIAELQRSDPVDAASNLVFLAERIRNMTEIAPAFRAAVRDARNTADCGIPGRGPHGAARRPSRRHRLPARRRSSRYTYLTIKTIGLGFPLPRGLYIGS